MHEVFRNSVKDGMLTPAGCRAPKKPGPLSPRWRTPGLHRHMRPCIAQGCLCLCGLKDAPVRGKGEFLPEFQRELLELTDGAAKAVRVRPVAYNWDSRWDEHKQLSPVTGQF